MFSIRGIFIFLFAAAATLVFARDPSADELDAVEQAFIDAGLIPSVFPETALEAFFLLGFVDANGTETQAVKTPGDIVNTTSKFLLQSSPVLGGESIFSIDSGGEPMRKGLLLAASGAIYSVRTGRGLDK